MGERGDRFDSNFGDGASFIMGVLTGTALGVGLGMLFAPKAGRQLRSEISEQGTNLATAATEQFRRATETASDWADRGREMSEQAVSVARSIVG